MKKGLSRLVTSRKNPGGGAVRVSPGVYRQAAPQMAPQGQPPMPQQMPAPQAQMQPMAMPRPVAGQGGGYAPQPAMPQPQMGKQWIRG